MKFEGWRKQAERCQGHRKRQRKPNFALMVARTELTKPISSRVDEDLTQTESIHGFAPSKDPIIRSHCFSFWFPILFSSSVRAQRFAMSEDLTLVDIGINLTHQPIQKHWRDVVQRAIDARVETMLLTGTSIETSKELLAMARTWFEESGTPNLFVTIGVHPHDAKTWDEESADQMEELLEDDFAVAVGECGLDYNRNFSTPEEQKLAFREQLNLACELDLPVFVHEREAHEDLIQIIDKIGAEAELPPLVVHCFTGNEKEAVEYVRRGYYIGFTGTICKAQRGAHLRDLIPKLPLESLMVETDAPFMGFRKGKKRFSEPADVVDIARKLAESRRNTFETLCRVTTKTAREFFRIEDAVKKVVKSV